MNNSLIPYFTVALQLIPDKELKALFNGFGYSEPVTPELCLAAFEENGADFGVPFGSLAKEAFESDMAQAYFSEAAKRVNRATDGGPTNEELAFKWCSFITDTLINGAGTVKEVLNSTNGTYSNQAAAALAQAEAVKAQNQARNTRTLVFGVGVILVIIVLIVVLVPKGKG